MSYMHKLYETYENCQSEIGKTDGNKVPLLPIYHTTQQAQIEIILDQEGNFKRAGYVSRSDTRTIIPCTESSGGRSSGVAPHPLCDGLQYIAKDYKYYGGKKAFYFKEYRDAMEKWCNSEYSHPKLKAIFNYIEKGNVVKDLIGYDILHTDENSNLLGKWDKKLFKDAPASSQDSAFVRWIVQIPGVEQDSVWTDSELFNCWAKYYSSTKDNNELCYITGKILPATQQHPRNIRRDGDGAKLISSGKTKDQNGDDKPNDPTGFTFLGRFTDVRQACSVSSEVSQKAHFALRWLIGRQSYITGDQVILSWATTGEKIIDPFADPFTLDEDEPQIDTVAVVLTAQELAIKLGKKIAGYGTKLGDTTGVVVLGLDSATKGKGRIAVVFYRELTGSDFLNKIENWHNTCCWVHRYHAKEITESSTGKLKKIYPIFVGAPAPRDIVDAVYGKNVSEKLRKATIQRILTCIIDGQKIPRDLVDSAVQRASNRIGMDPWDWNKTLSIACALYKKYWEKENLIMALDEKRNSRDYLYGRLLALADGLEGWALKDASDKRPTNAARLMQRFADHPYATWKTIELALGYSRARLGGARSFKYDSTISKVMAMFEPEEFMSAGKLSGEFLLGYHCQRDALWNTADKGNDTDSNTTINIVK